MKDTSIWARQHEEYCLNGPRAWTEGNVPLYLTSNTLIARHYAQIIEVFVRECCSKGLFNAEKPLTIVDLGAGVGRFAFYLLKELLPRLSLCHVSIRYVMTDIAEDTMDYVVNHPLIKQYVDEGVVDTAFFDGNDIDGIGDLLLRKSGMVLSEGTLENPLVVLGGYFFDIIKNDIFTLRDDVLYERNFHYDEKSALWPLDPHKISYCDVALTERGHYEDRRANNIIESYCQGKENAFFSIPIGALATLRRFYELSRGRMFFLAADQGVVSDEQILRCDDITLSCHGSFSVPVNYNAVARYVRGIGGFFIAPENPHKEFIVTLSLLMSGIDFPNTIKAYRNTVLEDDIYDYYLSGDFVSSLDDMIALLERGGGDAVMLNYLLPRIKQEIVYATDDEKRRLCDCIIHAADNFYPMSGSDLSFFSLMARLLLSMGFPNHACEISKRML